MSDTPRTNAARPPFVEMQDFVAADFARQLERELNESHALIESHEQELSSIYATSASEALAEANAANVNLLGLLEKSHAREAQLRAALDAPPHDTQHVECVCYSKNPTQVQVGYICNKCKALTLPAPPVVPVEDVKPLVEALQRFTNPTDEGPTLHSIISNALSTFTAKHKI